MMKYACVFPGQGSQHQGLLHELSEYDPSLLDTFNAASMRVGYDIWALAQHGPQEQLHQTQYTQVVMLTADVAAYRTLMKRVVAPASVLAGHSLGEYAALVCAQSISLEDAVALVQKRGQLMQDLIPAGVGAMAAIVGLSDEDVEAICAEVSTASSLVTPANYNALGQVVIAGHTQAVEKAIQVAQDRQARLAKMIPVSVPCHCPLLKATAEHFQQALEDVTFRTPDIRVISNVDLSEYSSPAHIKKQLTAQLYSPVRWVETIQLMHTQGVSAVVECGPGKVLCGLNKRIDKQMQTYSVHDSLGRQAACHALTGDVTERGGL